MAGLVWTALHIVSCWMTCSHTSYAITLVHTTELVPSPFGKVHMVLDTLGHGVCFLLFRNWAAGIYFAWHASEYFWRPIRVGTSLIMNKYTVKGFALFSV